MRAALRYPPRVDASEGLRAGRPKDPQEKGWWGSGEIWGLPWGHGQQLLLIVVS